jgi:multidrug transporter EmrE-like cation transporter
VNQITPVLFGKVMALLVLQVTGIVLLPRTKGFTKFGMTLSVLAIFGVSFWLMARIIHGGANLGILVPFMGAANPLATVVFGILVYGESASPLRVTLLVLACISAGVASCF